ncbi:hypothetical protein MZO42_13195 [Sphingomonas psychrotolerans]|uniref:Uncharacterized protein n=1 Tax=Sphingomonas psychrotolerans TaxID=1327635 RepID=A0ABU3N543_9SPHN|nr:hypothetical protein [Sphingomonas psychrotolerans]MDT8759655.1 hypothetical protein [Sphingomonas psychrotolerans]
MNVATNSVVPIIAAVMVQARKRIAAHFLVHHAISPEDAVPYVPTKGMAEKQFRRMRAEGIVREASPGRFWFDREAWKAAEEAKRRVLIPVLLILLLVLAVIPLFFYRGH